LFFQSGKPFAPFDGFSDTIWQQRLIEDSIGKGKRDRLFQTVRHPAFDPSTMAITSEAKRRKVMKKLPGPVSGDFVFSLMQWVQLCVRRNSVRSIWLRMETSAF
jgi:hypothetical protein